MSKGISLYQKAKIIIPGGTQLLSKRPEMFLPEQWPSYYSKCKGVEVWDLDGNRYTDMTSCGVGACTLGYADPDVDSAVIEKIKTGNMCTLNVPEEVELAELLCGIHPWAEMVRYARTGGEAMAIAVRIVRAATGKEKILFCGYHGWHDWYLSANLAELTALDGQLLPGLEPAGVPRGLRETAIPFYYNNLESFQSLVNQYDGQIAAVVMEPVRNYWPKKDFLEGIRQITKEKNIPLVFDEVTSCLRMTPGGIHLKLGIEPEVCVFAKALGNGYPMAAIIGKSKIMNAAQKTFISSTYWTDRIGPTAALATLKKHKKLDVSSHLVYIGNLVQEGWKNLAKKYDLNINITGIPPLSHWQIETGDSQLLHTIVVEKMIERGFLTSNAFYATYAHTKEHVNSYLNALNDVLGELVPYIKDSKLRAIYQKPIAHTGFRRLT
jgi:glutamate-1-semialdehyde aminotransferase